MKLWRVLVWCSVLILSAGVTLAASVSGGTIGGSSNKLGSFSTTGTFSSTKACAANFTRISPNYCADTAGTFTTTALTRDACTTIAAPAADAKAVMMYVTLSAKSNNGIALRQADVLATANDSTTCASAAWVGHWQTNANEFSATAAGTVLSRYDSSQILKVSPTQNIYLQFADDAGNQGSANYRIVGYFD